MQWTTNGNSITLPYVAPEDDLQSTPATIKALAEAIVVELEATSSSSLPVGTIIQAVAQPSDLWILCDGGMYAKDDIGERLYEALDEYWSHGEISVPDGDPMPVPDLRGRVVIGAGADGHPANTVDRPIGRRGGDTREQRHTHQPAGATLSTLYQNGGSPLHGWNPPGIDAASPQTSFAGEGYSGNMPPYAVIPSFIYAGKPGPFTKVGDIKDTYPAPNPSPASTLDIEDGKIPVPPDVENNSPDGYWEAS